MSDRRDELRRVLEPLPRLRLSPLHFHFSRPDVTRLPEPSGDNQRRGQHQLQPGTGLGGHNML